MEHSEQHNPGEPEFGEHSDEAPHNPGEPEFREEHRSSDDPRANSPESAPDDAGA